MSISTQITVVATAEQILVTAPGALRGPPGDVTPEALQLLSEAEAAANSAAGYKDESAQSAEESRGASIEAADAADRAEVASDMTQDAAGIVGSIAEGLASGKRFFNIFSPDASEVLIWYENVGGSAVDTGKRTIDASVVRALEAKSRFTYFTNTLYWTGYESGRYTGVVSTPTKAKATVINNNTWSSMGVIKALRLEILEDWSEVAPKIIYDANVIADQQATIALNPATPADFHAGDTINFRMLYRSNKAATFAMVIIKADGTYDSIAGGTPGRINLPSTGGAVVQISLSVVANSATASQAIVSPRIYGLDNQAFLVGDYIEIVDMVMQKPQILVGINYKNPTKDDLPKETFDLAKKLELKSRFTYYTNVMYATGYDGGVVTGAATTPAKASIGLVSNDSWSLVGARKALRIELVAAWPDVATKALYDAVVLADKMATIALSPSTPADFHAGDTINFRMSYRSNKAMTCALVIFKADGLYDSIAGGSVSARTLPSTNGEIAEVQFSVVANSASANQAIISPRIYGVDAQTFLAGDYIEVVDMVMQKLPVSKGINYRNATRDDLLRYSTAAAGKNLFDMTKAVPGRQVSATGAIAVSATSTLSPYVPVAGLRSIAVSGLQSNPASTRYYAFYAKDKVTVVSAGGFLAAGQNAGVIQVPNGSEWFLITVKRVSADPDNLGSIQVEPGRFFTAYSSYVPGVNAIDLAPFVSGAQAISKSSANMAFIGFGDSITTTGNWTNSGVYTDLGTRPWPKIVKDLLPMGSLTNYATSGAAYRDRPAPITDWQKISHQITKAAEFNTPGDVVFIACGTNDGVVDLGDYDTAMSKASLAALDRTKLYEALRWAYWSIATNWPAAVYFTMTPIQRADATPESLEPLYTAIKRMAARYNFNVIDTNAQSGIIKDFEVPSGVGRWLRDGLHPSDAGQVKLSECPMKVMDYTLNW